VGTDGQIVLSQVEGLGNEGKASEKADSALKIKDFWINSTDCRPRRRPPCMHSLAIVAISFILTRTYKGVENQVVLGIRSMRQKCMRADSPLPQRMMEYGNQGKRYESSKFEVVAGSCISRVVNADVRARSVSA
jgi:hypothetical protein